MSAPGWLAPLAPYGGALLLIGCVGCVAVWSLPSAAELRLRLLTPRPAGGTVHSLWTTIGRATARRPGRLRARRLRACVELCRALAAELRGGGAPATALGAAARETDPLLASELSGAVALAGAGHDPVPALLAAAERPGAAGLAHLAACWRVAASSGNGLATAVERLAEGLTQEEALRQELSAQLAGPRATALLLAVLPLLGLVMAGALGGSPLSFLLTTAPGLACLTAGGALNALGLWWTRRMVNRVLAAVRA
nr:type II secretion system F family protein [Actinorugispora endophytica]